MNLDLLKEAGRAGGRLWVSTRPSGPAEEVAAEVGERGVSSAGVPSRLWTVGWAQGGRRPPG